MAAIWATTLIGMAGVARADDDPVTLLFFRHCKKLGSPIPARIE